MSMRYPVAIALLMLQFGSTVHAGDKPAAETINTMPMNWDLFGVHAKAVIYKESMLVINSKDGVAAVVFDKSIANGVTYRYRFLPKGQDKEQIGEGKVFEKSKTIWSFLFFKYAEDDGGKTVIQAGPISLTWSFRDRGSGWILDVPKDIRIQTADAMNFTKIDLKRFMK